ncbi:MAG: hypothetical protein NVSMB2_26100 [Chloroflexota bacterium]
MDTQTDRTDTSPQGSFLVQAGGGWMGSMGQLLHFLRTIGVDQDSEARPAVRGTIASLLGLSGPDVDVVVGDDAQYRYHARELPHDGPFESECANCSWSGVAAGLNGTSYGLRNVTVI